MIRVLTPRSVEEIRRALRGDPQVLPLAGCTDLMAGNGPARGRPQVVMDLLGVRELQAIRRREDGWWIGATATFAQIARSRGLRAQFPILVQAAAHIGGWQIRNRATLGGNVATASPAGDSLPVLLVLDAVVVVLGGDGTREIPYEAFTVGYRRTALRMGEIIGWIRIPDVPRDAPAPRLGSDTAGAPQTAPERLQFFRKVGTRQAQAVSKVVVAMAAWRIAGRLASVRLAAGSVAPVPLRLRAAERICEGRCPDRALAEEAAAAAAAETAPIDDVRSTAEYRRFVLGRLVRRMILQCMGREGRRMRRSGDLL